MGKNWRAKRNEMFSEYCLHTECGSYMEELEQYVNKMEFQKTEAKDIIQKCYDRLKGYPTSDTDLVSLRDRAKAFLEATNNK